MILLAAERSEDAPTIFSSYLGAAIQIQPSPLAKLGIEMAQRADKTKTEGDEARLPASVVLKPPVSADDLKADTEHDPEGAEEFVALIYALRHERSRSIAL